MNGSTRFFFLFMLMAILTVCTAIATRLQILTHTATPRLADMPTEIPTPTLGLGSTLTREKDGMVMVYVPEGSFEMGSESGDSVESPVHTVTLDAFWIDKTEVTNAMYAEFLNAMGNQVEGGEAWFGVFDAFGKPRIHAKLLFYAWRVDSGYSDHPVTEVSWYGAAAYCDWAGGRLPTEAEWEKAARGTDGRKYPWGDGSPSGSLANHNLIPMLEFYDTTPVGSYPEGASPYGVLDMAGNVWEWVDDWFDAYPGNTISNSHYGTTYRVARGGSFVSYNENLIRSSFRNWSTPGHKDIDLGFRCSRSP